MNNKSFTKIKRLAGGLALTAALSLAAVPVSATAAEAPGTDGQAEAAGTDGQAKAPGTDGQAKAAGPAGQAEAAGTDGQAEAAGTDGQAKAAGTDGQAEVPGTAGQAEAAGTDGGPQKETQASAVREVSETEIDAFFDNSVFIGDSVMLGFRNYSMKRQDTFLGKINFLAAGNFSVNHALSPVAEKSVHPVYQGRKRPIWESVSMMQSKKVFLFFGLNDLNISGVDGTCEKYKEVVEKIRELSPDADICILSMTYTLRGKGKGRLKNDVIRQFNTALQQMAADNGWSYVDLATPLADENGDLALKYCSDNYVHQTPEAYDMWTAVLRDYARNLLKYTPAPAEPEYGRNTRSELPL